MSKHVKNVLKVLDNKILELAALKVDLNLVSKPSDFTRERKLPFKDMVKMITFMSNKAIKEELYDYFDYDEHTATSSAFIQARDKLLPQVFEELFHMMNKAFPCEEIFKGYQLIAVDGSDLNIPLDSNDLDTYHTNGDIKKGTSLFHINAAYDILNSRYIDLIIQGCASMYEQKAMCEMVERYRGTKAIFIADRNYATWNVMEHIIKAGQSFLIKAKDIHTQSSLLRKFNLPDEEFDLDVEVTLTNKQTKEIKDNPHKYRFISTTTTFDFIDSNTPFYDVKYRVVRFKIDSCEEYESIITNLDRNEFPPSLIKELYNKRWGIEVSFKHLKYSTNLAVVHATKRNSIKQEIWARATLYNISMIIIKHISQKINNQNKKWFYTINVTRAIHIIRNVTKRKGGIPPDLDKIIIKELLPVRPNRSEPRNVVPRHAASHNYNLC